MPVKKMKCIISLFENGLRFWAFYYGLKLGPDVQSEAKHPHHKMYKVPPPPPGSQPRKPCDIDNDDKVIMINDDALINFDHISRLSNTDKPVPAAIIVHYLK